MRLDELFEVRNGLASSQVTVLTRPEDGAIPYVRPASTQQRTVAGWVKRDSVNSCNIYPEDTLFVSTDGEGSHSYSYVSRFDFVPNSNVSVLIPKHEMTLQEKVFFACCITMNRYLFSYGRKPKGDRLKKIGLPDTVPAWVNAAVIPDNSALAASVSTKSLKLNTYAWQAHPLQDLFEIKKGKRLTKANMSKGNTPYIGAIESKNGVTAMIGQSPIHSGNTISVSYNGSVAEAFYQPTSFWATDDVNVLYPKFIMTPEMALFICTVIRQEKFRFNYGRKWHLERMRSHEIKLPAQSDGSPDFKFMENYVKALPYSSQIRIS